ncbi:endothelin-1 [Takifugu rubripes]|uniref:endothelin-1 n=1 Tax=Takifugu rubripes TaxID=31033 RepID=UPI0011456277|nr:endothelin-1 [Takifugu rubripes]
MDLCILSSVLSIMYSCMLHTVPAVAASADAPEHHLRTKRCSCATFLDKECVYFCHLDIIWVNTPERVVSYGLGSAPRTKRAVDESMATSSGPRCRCLRQKDNRCRRFCLLGTALRSGPSAGLPIRRQQLATETGSSVPRNSGTKQAIRSAWNTRLLLGKWRPREHHRVTTDHPGGDG